MGQFNSNRGEIAFRYRRFRTTIIKMDQCTLGDCGGLIRLIFRQLYAGQEVAGRLSNHSERCSMRSQGLRALILFFWVQQAERRNQLLFDEALVSTALRREKAVQDGVRKSVKQLKPPLL